MISAPRARRAAAAGLGSLTLLAGALAAPAAAAAPATAPSTADDAPFCSISDLTISYHATDAGAGHRYGRVVLRNRTRQACRTHGYGGISYTDDLGHQIGAAATRTSATQPHLLLEPGQRAVSRIDEVVAQNFPSKRCHPAAVSDLKVYPPEGEYAVLLTHRTTGCENTAVTLISHGPYRRP